MTSHGTESTSQAFADRDGVLRVAYDDPPRSYPLFHGPRVKCAADGQAHPFFPGTVHYVGSRYPYVKEHR